MRKREYARVGGEEEEAACVGPREAKRDEDRHEVHLCREILILIELRQNRRRTEKERERVEDELNDWF